MFYIPTPGCREETSLQAVRMRSIGVLKTCQSPNLVHVMATVAIWPQFNNFQRKMGTGFHKSVKHCKILTLLAALAMWISQTNI